jgi:hypothetical protein
MAKRKAGSQTGSLTPDHKKLGIDSIPLRAGGVRHIVEKLLMRATTLVGTSPWLEVYTRSYSLAKLWNSQPWRFRDSHLGVLGQKTIRMPFPWSDAEYTIWGKAVASPESGPWCVLWVRGRPWLVLAPKVLQPNANQLACWFCVGLLDWVSCLTLVLVPSRSFNTPFYAFKVQKTRSVPRVPNLSAASILRFSLSLPRGLGARH